MESRRFYWKRVCVPTQDSRAKGYKRQEDKVIEREIDWTWERVGKLDTENSLIKFTEENPLLLFWK